MTVTVCSITGINPEAHQQAIDQTCLCLPFPAAKLLHVVPGMTKEEYSRFMVKDLARLIHTDFALTVQADGFGVNLDLWDDVFLEYGYVGSPWPWPPYCANGGLSLRSRKFLELSAQLPDPDLPEDFYLCVKHREWLENNGIEFAPISICSKFGYELPVQELPWHKPEKSWGRHGNHA